MPEIIIRYHGEARYTEIDESTMDDVSMILETSGCDVDFPLDDDPGIVRQEISSLWCGKIQGRCDGSRCPDCHLFPKGDHRE